jgi:hypothetical protein
MKRLLRRLRIFLAQPRNADRVGLVTAAFVSGLVAVGYAQLFKRVENVFVHVGLAHPLWLLIITPACFVSGWWLVARFAPYAGGSGIPQVMAAMELQESATHRTLIGSLLGVRVAVVKIASSLLCILGGGVAGREGPTLQVSASIFYSIGQRTRAWTSAVALESWILAGAAAGMAKSSPTSTSRACARQCSPPFSSPEWSRSGWSEVISISAIPRWEASACEPFRGQLFSVSRAARSEPCLVSRSLRFSVFSGGTFAFSASGPDSGSHWCVR